MACVFALITLMVYVAYRYRLIRIGYLADPPRIPKGIPMIVFHDVSHVPYYMKKCCICLLYVVDGDELSSLPPCKHVFHRNCIAPFLAPV